MRWSLTIFIGLMLLCNTCRQPTETAGNKHLRDSVLQLSGSIPADSTIIDSINALIDVTYDNPEQVILQPDSFINQISVMPATTAGAKSYTLLLLNIGYVLREHGSILPSIRFYERALNYSKKHHLKKPDFVLYIAKPLANLYTRIDDIQKSISLQEEAIRIASQKGQQDYLPSLYNNLSIAYLTNANFKYALKTSRKGLSYVQRKSIYRALLYNNLANAYVGLNKIDSAAFFNQKSLSLFQNHQLKKDTLIWFGGALKLNSDIASYQNNVAKAIHSLDRVINLTTSNFPHSNQRVKAKYYLARGQLTMDRYPQAAISDFHAVMNLLHTDSQSFYVPDYTYTDALHSLAKIYTGINRDSALFYYSKTIENDYLTQELIVSKASNYKNSKWSRAILSDYVSLLWKTYQDSPQEKKKQLLALRLFWAIEMSKGRQVQREINRSRKWGNANVVTRERRLREKLKMLNQQLATTTHSGIKKKLTTEIERVTFRFQVAEKYFEQAFQSIDFEKFKHFILRKSQTQTLVSYLMQKDSLSYVVCLSDAIASIYPISRGQIKKTKVNQFTTNYFGNTPYTFENNPKLYFIRAKKVAKYLLPFISTSKNELIISPDGLLFRLPMDALIYRDKFIVETHTISYTYSFILNFLNKSKKTYASDVLFFGISHYKGKFKNLRFVEEEQEKITGHFQGVTFEGQDATIQSFISHLHQKDIIHLATHAVSDPKPYIVFEKPLTLGSLSLVNMQSPLVVLSSCESAGGKLIKAEGLESLNKAFISKGVKGVIAAQWPVDDASISELMGLFYKELYTLKSPVKALTEAKRTFINEKNAIYSNPWYWASMNYMGVETRIQIQKKSPIWIWGALLALIGLSLFLFFRRR